MRKKVKGRPGDCNEKNSAVKPVSLDESWLEQTAKSNLFKERTEKQQKQPRIRKIKIGSKFRHPVHSETMCPENPVKHVISDGNYHTNADGYGCPKQRILRFEGSNQVPRSLPSISSSYPACNSESY